MLLKLTRYSQFLTPYLLLQALDYRNSYENYAYLWVDDRHEFLRQFLLYGHVLTHEEIEAAGEDGVPLNSPTLEQFKQQVDTYENVYSVVEQFKVSFYQEY